MILASMNEDVRELNRLARERLQAVGKLGAKHQVGTERGIRPAMLTAPDDTAKRVSMVYRAAASGWLRERIAVIDDDLGKSSASSVERRSL